MCARLRAFFQHHHRDVLAFFSRQLFDANRAGQAGRAAADDHHVVFHGFARPKLGKYVLGCHKNGGVREIGGDLSELRQILGGASSVPEG